MLRSTGQLRASCSTVILDYAKAKVLGYVAIYEKIHLSCYASAISSENPAISVVLTYPDTIQLLLFALPLTREYLEENNGI